MINRRTFPIDTASPYAVKRMAEHLQQGGRLVLFAEGRISRTGALMKLFDGTGFLLHKTHAKVITCYLRGAAALRWSRASGLETLVARRVTAHFSAVLEPPRLQDLSTTQARTAHRLAARPDGRTAVREPRWRSGRPRCRRRSSRRPGSAQHVC